LSKHTKSSARQADKFIMHHDNVSPYTALLELLLAKNIYQYCDIQYNHLIHPHVTFPYSRN